MRFKKIIKRTTLLFSILLGTITFSSCDIDSILSEFGLTDDTTNSNTNEDNNSSNNNNSNSSSNTTTTDSTNVGVMYDDFQIHFMMLGNDKAGDSIYIKAGDNDIVIDAGSTQASSATTEAYIDNYCTDGKLEYVILTHGDSDHVSSFTDTTKQKGLLSYYEIGTIIDSAYTTKTTKVYEKYITLRDSLVENGTKHYTSKDCWNNENGASRSYQLSDNVTMNILYNYYYFNDAANTDGGENNYSVCTLFTYTDGDEEHNFILTGDLELEGEEKMAEYYDGSTDEKTLPHCDLYKAGHHGSKTSSNDCLLSLITPSMCVVSCCCGTDEYTENIDNQFPTQAFISRISKYTDAVYVTSTYETLEIDEDGTEISTDGYKALNGNIVVSCGKNENNEVEVGLACSNNTTKLKDSDWFNLEITISGKTRKMRVWE